MDQHTAMMLVRSYSSNRLLAPYSEGYGIEVEVEGLEPRPRTASALRTQAFWAIKDDGSLRNGGAEFVSRFLHPQEVDEAINLLYTTKRHWHPSERTGIHIHANMLHLNVAQLYRVLQYYAFVEPLLYTWADENREENIFCVPWYRAPAEAELVGEGVRRGDLFAVARGCKYSALYCGPLISFGTIEFRHATTFETAAELMDWARVVRAVANSWSMPDPIDLYARHGAAFVARQCLGSLLDHASDDDLDGLIETSGASEVALLLSEPEYRFGEWGEPGSFRVEGEGRASVRIDDDFEPDLVPTIDHREEEDEDEYREEDEQEEFTGEDVIEPAQPFNEIIERVRRTMDQQMLAQLREARTARVMVWDELATTPIITQRGNE